MKKKRPSALQKKIANLQEEIAGKDALIKKLQADFLQKNDECGIVRNWWADELVKARDADAHYKHAIRLIEKLIDRIRGCKEEVEDES